MDKSLQKKLVGAAVLIALAVIFLPMLLNGKKEPENVTMQIEIPPKPTFEVPNRLEQPRQPVAAAEAPVTITESPATMSQTIAAAPQVSEPLVVTPQTQVPVIAPAPVEPAPKPVEVVKAAPAATPAPARPAATASPSGAGFVVQVGSFGKMDNAERLQEKLVSQGFPAFVEASDAGGKQIFRVKVGPRPNRNDVDDLRIRLLDDAKLEGIIVSHP